MNSISWPAVAFFWGTIGASFGFSWLISRNASEGDKRLHDRCDKIIETLSAFREYAARQYFERTDAKGLETRLEARLQRIEDKLDSRIMNPAGGSDAKR